MATINEPRRGESDLKQFVATFALSRLERRNGSFQGLATLATDFRRSAAENEMSAAIEVYCQQSSNSTKEKAHTSRVATFGGRLDYREDSTELTGVCLTYEFDSWEKASEAAESLRQLGEHVEGPMDYAS